MQQSGNGHLFPLFLFFTRPVSNYLRLVPSLGKGPCVPPISFRPYSYENRSYCLRISFPTLFLLPVQRSRSADLDTHLFGCGSGLLYGLPRTVARLGILHHGRCLCCGCGVAVATRLRRNLFWWPGHEEPEYRTGP